MKTAFALALLVLCLHSVRAKLAPKSETLFPNQARKLQTVSVESLVKFGGATNSNTQMCAPIIYTDIGYHRNGAVSNTFTNISQVDCHSLCHTLGSACVVYNYNPNNGTCQLLDTIGRLVKDDKWTSSMSWFEDDDMCSANNFEGYFHRPSGDYGTPHKVATPKDCCELCKADTPKCVAWVFKPMSRTQNNYCYLKSIIYPLIRDVKPKFVTGMGRYCI